MSKYSAFYRDGEIYLRVPSGGSWCDHGIDDSTAHRLSIEIAEAMLQRDKEEMAAMEKRLAELQKKP